jgi:hypothetical protein
VSVGSADPLAGQRRHRSWQPPGLAGNGLHDEANGFGKILEPAFTARSGELAIPGGYGLQPLDQEWAGPVVLPRLRVSLYTASEAAKCLSNLLKERHRDRDTTAPHPDPRPPPILIRRDPSSYGVLDRWRVREGQPCRDGR